MLAVGLLLPHAVAQDDAPPKEPLVAPLPDSVVYTMTFSKPKRASTAKAGDPSKQLLGDTYVRTLEVTKSGSIRREKTTWSNNKTTEAWVTGGMNVTEDQTGQIAIAQISGPNEKKGDGKSDFPMFTWINLKNYKDVENVSGKKCYVYKQTLPLTQVLAGYFEQVSGMS